MAAAKLIASAAEGVPFSTIVTTMSRNGTDFGIRTSGTGPAWFTAPAPPVDGVFFPGYGPADAGLDIGDSAITETVGLGAFAMAAAPGIAGLVGKSHQELVASSAEMAQITAGRNPSLAVPQWDFAGVLLGIDVRRVVQTSVLPVIDTATSHHEPGHRSIGAGFSRARQHVSFRRWRHGSAFIATGAQQSWSRSSGCHGGPASSLCRRRLPGAANQLAVVGWSSASAANVCTTGTAG